MITYETSSNRNLIIKTEKNKHLVFPNSSIELSENELNSTVTFEVENGNDENLFLRFVMKMLFFVVEILTMNFLEKWYLQLDPFSISFTYFISNNDLTIKYIPSTISLKPLCVKKPQLIINEETVEAVISMDESNIDRRFREYCIDFSVNTLYYITFITLLFYFSGVFIKYLTLYIFLISIYLLPAIYKCYKVKKEKDKLEHFVDLVDL